MNDLSLSLTPLKSFVRKHHPVLFISLICILLAGAIFALYQVLDVSSQDESSATSSIGQFDQKTIERIDSLSASGDNSESLVFPSPRPNPFAE